MKVRIGVFFLLMSTAMAGADETLDRLRSVFETHLAQLQEAADNRLEHLLDAYARAVVGLRDGAQQKGDFDGLVSLNAEIERFAKERTFLLAEDAAAHPEWQRLLIRVREVTQAEEQRCATDIMALVERYSQALDDQIRQRVRDGQMDAAVAYRNELARVGTHPAVQSAEFTHAIAGANDPPPAEASPPDQAPVTSPPVRVSAASANRSDGTIRPGVVSLSMDSPFVRQTLQPSQNPVSIGSGLVGEVYIDETTPSKRISVRVTLRSRERARSFENLRIILQAYSRAPLPRRPQGTTYYQPPRPRTSMTPREIALAMLKIDRIDGDGVTCEFVPISQMKTRFDGGPNVSIYQDTTQQNFYGLIVSVFDAEDKLIYQVCTQSLLRELGRTAPPRLSEQQTYPMYYIRQ